MNEGFRDVVASRHQKEAMVAYMQAHPEHVPEAIRMALNPKDPVGWRAIWILRESRPKGSLAILVPYLDEAIGLLPSYTPGHQREWLKTMVLCPLTEAQESALYDFCLATWQQVSLPPALRMTAFLLMAGMVERYPELWNEIALVTQGEYREALTPGVRRAIDKRITALQKKLKL